MDPIEAFELGVAAANSENGLSDSTYVPRPFENGDYENLWRTSPKTVRKHLDAVLCGSYPDRGLNLLFKLGALQAVIPELKAIKNLGDADGLHKDVWSHTMGVIAGVPNSLELRWGALLHDIGKARTRRFIDGKVTFHGHDIVGSHIVEKMQERTNLFQDDVALYRTVRMLVKQHLRPASYKASWTNSAVRRLISDCADPGFFDKLMTLSRADLTTKVPKKRNQCMQRADALVRRVEHVLELDSQRQLPKNTMGVLIELSGRKPGQWCATMKLELESMLRSGKIPSDATAQDVASIGVTLLDPR